MRMMSCAFFLGFKNSQKLIRTGQNWPKLAVQRNTFLFSPSPSSSDTASSSSSSAPSSPISTPASATTPPPPPRRSRRSTIKPILPGTLPFHDLELRSYLDATHARVASYSFTTLPARFLLALIGWIIPTLALPEPTKPILVDRLWPKFAHVNVARFVFGLLVSFLQQHPHVVRLAFAVRLPLWTFLAAHNWRRDKKLDRGPTLAEHMRLIALLVTSVTVPVAPGTEEVAYVVPETGMVPVGDFDAKMIEEVWPLRLKQDAQGVLFFVLLCLIAGTTVWI